MVGAMAQISQPVPSGIVLNGLMTLSGDRQAFFKVSFTSGASAADFMLSEGQTRYGIRLLAVNTRSNVVTISSQGFTRNISICATPTLLASTDSGAGPATAANKNDPGADATGNSPASIDETQPADPPRFAHPVNAAGWGGLQNGSTSDPGNNTPSISSADSAGSTSAASSGDSQTSEHVYQWWVKEAEKVEQARQETAQRVLAGEWPPYPLTPLTPPGTPPQLVGADSVFMDHGPGILISSN